MRYDRATERLANATGLRGVESLGEAWSFLSTHGVPGDYAWHALLLGMSRGHVSLVPMWQLLLWALSLHSLFRLVLALHEGGPGGGPPGQARVTALESAWLAVVCYALIPVDFMIPHFLCSEALFDPLLVIGMSQVVVLVRRGGSLPGAAAAGVILGLACLTRPELLGWLLLLPGLLILVRRRGGAISRGALLLVSGLSLALPLGFAAHQAFTADGFGFGRAETHDLEAVVRVRVGEIEYDAGDTARPGGASSSTGLRRLVEAAAAHPGSFLRLWVAHSVKFLALPDNLDVFAYLGLFTRTGTRSNLVHRVGWGGALRAVRAEMPRLFWWLVLSVALFALFWALAVAGAVRWFTRGDMCARLTCALLVSLPVYYLLLRCLLSGSSRKRAPVDFVLSVLAAGGLQALWRYLVRKHGRGT